MLNIGNFNYQFIQRNMSQQIKRLHMNTQEDLSYGKELTEHLTILVPLEQFLN